MRSYQTTVYNQNNLSRWQQEINQINIEEVNKTLKQSELKLIELVQSEKKIEVELKSHQSSLINLKKEIDYLKHPPQLQAQKPQTEKNDEADKKAEAKESSDKSTSQDILKTIDLSPQEKRVLQEHWLEGKTLKTVGEGLDVTESRASQLNTRACSKIKRALVYRPDIYELVTELLA